MTQGGKTRERVSEGPASAFAPLRPWLAPDSRELEPAIKNLAAALADFGGEGKLSIEILDAEDSHHWVVGIGRGKASAERRRTTKADVRLVIGREAWIEICHGRLNPFDAFAGGRLQLGGDTELAKRLVRHLSDPEAVYLSPC